MEREVDKMTKRIGTRQVIDVCLIAFFAVCVIAPIGSMLGRITKAGWSEVVSSPQFRDAVKNSLLTSLTATLITLVLAFAAALCVERTAIRLKAVLNIIFVLPMLIPSISHAFGLVALFGANGLVTNWLSLKGTIYGFWGIAIGSVLYSFPVAFLMFSGILKYEDGSTHIAAEVLGVPHTHRFFDLTIPFVRKTFISAFFAVFSMIMTDYGVPLMIGGKVVTLSVQMYNKAVAMVDYDAGSVIGSILLIPAFVAFAVDTLTPDRGARRFVSEQFSIKRNAVRDVAASVFCVLLSVAIIAPICAFCFMVFETKYPVDPTFTLYHISKTINRGAGSYLLNSLVYAALTATFGTLVGFVCAYITTRCSDRFGKMLHMFSVITMAIPGIVLGLSYVIFFHDKSIYGTLLIVAIVNSVHFFASPYLMMYNAMGKVNQNLEAVGASLAVGRFYIIKDVIVPKVRGTLYEMFSYFFVNSMMTVSAVSFLAPPAPKPVALMINQFEAQLLMESAAFVSLMILGVNLFIRGIVAMLRKIGRE